MEYKQFQVRQGKKVYGIHDTIDTALADMVKRVYSFKQRVSVYGVKPNNELIKLA